MWNEIPKILHLEHQKMDKCFPGKNPVNSREKSGDVTFEQEVLALLQAAQQESKAALDRGRVDTTFQVGDQVGDQVMLQT